MYNEARMFGVATGVAVGLVLALVIVRTVNRDRKLRTEYDEMQKLARGQAYKYAFYAVMIYEALVCWLSMGIELPAEQSVIHFFGIFVGITVQACYCIWKDAYIGLNTNLKRYIILVTRRSRPFSTCSRRSWLGKPESCLSMANSSCRRSTFSAD